MTLAALIAGSSAASAASVGWSTPVSVDPTGPLSAVSCASSTFCVAVDNRFAAAGYALTFDGDKWSAPALIDPTGGFTDVSCPTTAFCAAVTTDGRVYTYDGSSWSVPTSLATGGELDSVSCASSSFCVATGSTADSGEVFTYDGTGWSAPLEVDTPNVIDATSCPTSSFCMAADDAGNALTFNGISWSVSWSAPTSIGDVNAVSCPTNSFCVAITDTGAVTYDDGVWSSLASILPGGGLLEGVSCSSSSFCTAVTLEDQALMFDGSAWSSAERIVAAGDGSTQLSSVSCVGSFCATVDHAGNALVYPVTTIPPASSAPTPAPRPSSSVPLAPSHFRAFKVSATSVTLSWRPAGHGEKPAGYEIAELAPHHDRYARIARLRPNRREYTVRRLRPGTRYRFRIESLGADGRVGRPATGSWITTRTSGSGRSA